MLIIITNSSIVFMFETVRRVYPYSKDLHAKIQARAERKNATIRNLTAGKTIRIMYIFEDKK